MQWNWRQVTARRLERHGLVGNALTDISDAVAAICGAHAQVMSAAEISLGIRMDGVTRSDVRDELWRERSLTKTFGPRGTVHLLPTRELGMWCGALAAVPARAGLAGAAGLDADQTDAVVAAIGSALEDGPLTVEELDAQVAARAGAWAADPVMPAFGGMWPRWRQAISTAANRGALCYGENRGAKATYARPPAFDPVPDAELELLERFLHAYGPATPGDFARWLAAPVGWANELFARADLQRVEVDLEADAVDLPADADTTWTAWVNAGDGDPADGDSPSEAPDSGIRLLPYFDPYVVGSHPRARVFPGASFERALGRGQAGVYPVLLIDGVAAGVWHHRRSGRRVIITVEPLVSLTRTQHAELGDQARRIGAILEGKAELTIGDVTVGPHA